MNSTKLDNLQNIIKSDSSSSIPSTKNKKINYEYMTTGKFLSSKDTNTPSFVTKSSRTFSHITTDSEATSFTVKYFPTVKRRRPYPFRNTKARQAGDGYYFESPL